MPLNDCKIIQLPKINDQRGNLTFIESDRHIPFDIKRVYYLYDVHGTPRPTHARLLPRESKSEKTALRRNQTGDWLKVIGG